MAKTVLSLLQGFFGEKGMPEPSGVVGVTDTAVIQAKRILERALSELSVYHWNSQKVEKSFTAANPAAEDQGVLTSVFGADFRALVPGTLIHVDENVYIWGPDSDVARASQQLVPSLGPTYTWKIIGTHLYISPAPTAAANLFAIYESNYPLHDGVSAIETISADDNTFLIPDRVVAAALEYRWKREKGEPWADDYAVFSDLLVKELGMAGLPILQLDTSDRAPKPGIVVPQGNW